MLVRIYEVKNYKAVFLKDIETVDLNDLFKFIGLKYYIQDVENNTWHHLDFDLLFGYRVLNIPQPERIEE